MYVVRQMRHRLSNAARSLSVTDPRAVSGRATGLPWVWATTRARTDVTVIRPSESQEQNIIFKPSPASLMCAGMSFSVSLFYPKVTLSSTVMTSALRQLADEVPILAGRMVKERRRIFSRFSDHVIVVRRSPSDVGFSLRTRARENDTLRHAVDAIWKNKDPHLLHERRPQSHTIEPISIGKTERDELAHVDVVNYSDGAVLTLHISHVLADAGRAIKLLERLSTIYEATHKNTPVPSTKITCDTWFGTAMKAMANQPSKAARDPTSTPSPTSPVSTVLNAIDLLRLRPSHILELPEAIRYYKTTKFVPVYIYVPQNVVTAMQVHGAGGSENARQTRTVVAPDPIKNKHPKLSRMDIVQALAVTFIRAARPEMDGRGEKANVIINMDLSLVYPSNSTNGRPDRPKSPNAVPDQRPPDSENDTLGNSSDFLQVRSANFHPTDVLHNAHLIRAALDEFRANADDSVKAAIEQTVAMSSLPKAAVHTAFIIHGAREKLASCTAVASFPIDAIRFGGVAPAFHSVSSHEGFDWWSIISRVSGELTPGMNGWIVAMNVPRGFETGALLERAGVSLLPCGNLPLECLT